MKHGKNRRKIAVVACVCCAAIALKIDCGEPPEQPAQNQPETVAYSEITIPERIEIKPAIVEPETPIETEIEIPVVDYSVEAEYIAKTIYGEARGCPAEEQEKVIWCILNRVDDPRFPNDIIDVITAPNQFHGYNANNPVNPDHYALALDVLARWELEKSGGESNRNLAPEYLYFWGDGKQNHFKTSY